MVFAVLGVSALYSQQYTRGVGVYPGAPSEDFSPVISPGGSELRNLALHRPAYHSSSYDYCLTAQLITDGIIDTNAPSWVAVSTSQKGVLKKNERDSILDQNWVSVQELKGKSAWIEFELGGELPEVDAISIDGSVRAAEPDNQQYDLRVLASNDGQNWSVVSGTGGLIRPMGELHGTAALKAPMRSRFYKLMFYNARPLTWRIGEVYFLRKGARVHVGGPFHFTSAWKSAGTGEEWVYVDLGANSAIESVKLHWIARAKEGSLQVSGDAKSWTTVQPLERDEIKLAQPVQARFVRVLMTKPASDEGYVLSEMEVMGRGGVVPVAKPAPPSTEGKLMLAGGAWKIERESQVKATGAALSTAGYKDTSWLPATVPGTALASYLNAGAIANPDFSDNQNMVSDSYFYSDFWYRTEFKPPTAEAGQHIWLNFNGVNWKAEVWLNGVKLGRIEGGFLRARYDVTSKLKAGAANALAVRMVKNATPGSVKEKTFESPDTNGGALGADNPTFHASIGWDWIPTIRGRNAGIWNDVSLAATGGVTVEDPSVQSVLPLPDTSKAAVTVGATVRNHDGKPVVGTLEGKFGELAFQIPVRLAANESKTVSTTLDIANPRLWWPNGYGAQNLYQVELKFGASDKKTFQSGIRQFTYSEDGATLRTWVNGRRFIPRGGNWGFSESMLRYRAREYEAAMRYHRDMNFNMVRNWVGQIGEDAFYEAADRNGIVIMQDFWLANPWDGPDPDDNAMFLANVDDTLRRIRTHPSIGLYCGRNEGYPLKPLEDGIRAALQSLHPDIHYIGSSADDVVSGHGPYQAQELVNYFTQRATPKFHSELGMPNIMTMDSLRQTMKPEEMWPLGRLWGLHDFCLTGAQGGQSFINRIDRSYGGASGVEEWVGLAQFINYEGHRAMFEAQSKNRMGLLIWMSHPAWPSMVWQTYDWFLEPTAAYFGAKKGSEPLHVQWNPASNMIELVNYSAGDVTGLTVSAELLSLKGERLWQNQVDASSKEDSVQSLFPIDKPPGATPVYFLRLRMTSEGKIRSENFYWLAAEGTDYTALRTLGKVTVDASTKAEREGSYWVLTTDLRNTGSEPALMVRLKAVRETSGDRILPAIYSDNYVAVMPGESKQIITTIEDADTRGEKPAIAVEGFNIAPVPR